MRIGGSAARFVLEVVRSGELFALRIVISRSVAGMLADDNALVDLQAGSLIIGPRSSRLKSHYATASLIVGDQDPVAAALESPWRADNWEQGFMIRPGPWCRS